uniref:Uncharacterized protein n=1 Tax=viral metagenome TaxID=1070528 RepID=A0A6M3LF01_9ZZZZ
MSKYYVRCGELDRIVLADSPEEAGWQAVLKANGETLGPFFYIDPRGFRGPIINEHNAFFIIDTNFLPEYTFPYTDIVQETED